MKKLILTYFISIITVGGLAQFYNDGATLIVQENAIISTAMNFENYGNILNKGSIYLSADWLNYNAYDTTGTLILNGQNTQTVNHGGQRFDVLVVDGAGEKLLSSDANIITELALRNGILTVSDGIKMILEKDAVSTNSSQNSFVNGLIYNTGTGYKFFPIGKDGSYSPVEFESIQNHSVVGMESFAPNFNTGAENGLTVSDDRYYQQTFLEGSNVNSKIAISYDNNYTATDFDNIVVVQANDNEVYQSIGNNLTSGVNIRGITSEETATKEFYSLALLGTININLFIPSALSANAPNIEDRVVKIYGDDFSENDFSFMVFNKWGNTVFSTNSLDFMRITGWDGTNNKNGKKEPNGMYSYVLKAKDGNGKKIEKTGTIMIIN